jgi:DNA-binding response OmpR family regulator
MPRCLIIDDDVDSRDGYAEYLRVFGFEVEALPDPRTALRVIANCRPDIVMLDLRMPYVDGFQFLERLRCVAGGTSFPVVVVSACVYPGDRARAAASGCAAFLAKPCAPNEVLSTIQRLLCPSTVQGQSPLERDPQVMSTSASH